MRWFTVHGGLRDHWKWLALSERDKAAWLTLMLIGNSAEPRWCVGRRDAVVTLLRRDGIRAPDKAVEALLAARLVDEDDDGLLWMHDAGQWQRKPSDDPERVRERVQQHRARSREEAVSTASVTPVTPGNAMSRPVSPTNKQTDIQTHRHAGARTRTRGAMPPPNADGLWHTGQHDDCSTCDRARETIQ